MKKLVLFLFLIVAAQQTVFAQYPGFGALKVNLSDNTPLTVSLDGRYFQKHGTSLTVGDLPPGKHRLKVFAYSPDGYTSVIYKGKVFTNESEITYITIDPRTGGATFNNAPLERNSNPRQRGSNMYDNGNGNAAANGNDNMQEPPPPANDDQYNNTNNNSAGNSGAPAASPVSSFSQASVDKLKTSVGKKITDTDRIKVLEATLKTESITTEQVGAMMDWLNFEASKVEFAKWAYSITADPENYRTLENKFTYQSSQDELEKYMNEK